MSDARDPESNSGAPKAARPRCQQVVATGLVDLASLRAVFAHWCLGGTPGSWFAVRGGVEVTSGPQSLLRRCLSASTLEALAGKLCLQDYLDSLNDEELTDVWQHVKLPHATEQVVS